ncbi:hypothetical protein HIR71_11375 [Cellulomonas fimi]|uniref:SAF domain-containing protein n=1 Tax=Cellulomonas fimi TaxID=1708 RepID=A0A7Y0LZK6_CELFI|nr:hypothetical protein [Cellulomonas fimi]
MDTMVLDPVSPVAARLRRPTWRDPRLLVGLVMIAGSVALGAWAVTSAQASEPVYVARTTLPPGTPIAADQLAVVQVRLEDDQAARYLPATERAPEGLVALRTVGEGELVALSAVGDAATLETRPVPVTVADAPPAGVVEGALVDLWLSPEATGTGSTVPEQLATSLEVAEVNRPTGAFAAGGGTTVHVLVPITTLPDVLSATAGDGTVQLVLVPGSGRAPGR